MITIDGKTHWAGLEGETYDKALEYYCGLDIKELRKRQDLCRQQQKMLYDQVTAGTFAGTAEAQERAASDLNAMDVLLMEAIGRITFGEDW